MRIDHNELGTHGEVPSGYVAPVAPDEAAAFLHAEREWNPLRTVGIGTRHFGTLCGTLSAGSSKVIYGERDTRAFVFVQNLSTADWLIVGTTEVQGTSGNPPVNIGTGFPVAPGKSVSIPTRDLIWLSTPTDAAAPVPWSTMEMYD